MDETQNTKIMEECPQFDTCSAPKCPLDSFIDKRVETEGDAKCKMEKNVRLRIGEKHGLPKKGLTNAEWAGKQQYERLTPEKKEKLRLQGLRGLKKTKSPLL